MFSFMKGYGAVTGVDIDKSPVYSARSFSQGHGADNTNFAISSLDALPFDDNTYDIIILRDVVEQIPRHLVANSLRVCKRVLKKDGRICISLPPWSWVFASHLDEYIGIPWCHLIFSSQSLVNVLTSMNPHKRFGELSEVEHFRELNRVSIDEFKRHINDIQFKVIHFRLRMILGLRFLQYIPFLNTYFTSRVIAVLSK